VRAGRDKKEEILAACSCRASAVKTAQKCNKNKYSARSGGDGDCEPWIGKVKEGPEGHLTFFSSIDILPCVRIGIVCYIYKTGQKKQRMCTTNQSAVDGARDGEREPIGGVAEAEGFPLVGAASLGIGMTLPKFCWSDPGGK
jgi:hypothetical protein